MMVFFEIKHMGLLEKNASVWHQAELTLLIIDILYVERYYIDEKQRGIARLEILSHFIEGLD